MSMDDVAQAIELREWEANNLGRQDKPLRFDPADAGYGPDECEDCGNEMPAERRAWGYTLCVPCKTVTEARRLR